MVTAVVMIWWAVLFLLLLLVHIPAKNALCTLAALANVAWHAFAPVAFQQIHECP